MKNIEEITASVEVSEIASAFENIIGQELAKEKLILSIEAANKGEKMKNFFITGPAGNGKSAIAHAMKSAYQAAGFGVLWFDSPKDFRIKGEAYSTMIQAITEPDSMGEKGCVVFLDECHLFNETPTVQTRLIKEFVMKFTDGNNEGRTIRLGEELTTTVNRRKLSFVLMTNFPNSLDKSEAFQSRFSKIQLDLYNKEELIQILQLQLAKQGLQHADENTLALIANTGRGTARPMEQIVHQVKDICVSKGKKTVSRPDVLQAMKLARVYPLGPELGELRMMAKCKKGSYRDNVLCSMLNVDASQYKKSKSFLLGIGFIAQTSQGVATSEKGQAYLQSIAKDGFNIDV